MSVRANMIEMFRIINSEHAEPHSVLGCHVLEGEGAAVRVFIPQAKSVKIRETETGDVHDMEKLHVDGFFELVLPDKNEFFDYDILAKDYFGNEWTTKDAYNFLPVISEYDVFLFNKGSHYKIFDKLGAHVMEINGVYGVLFAVWAPNAKRVSVIGDFNAWDGRRNPMRQREQSGVWELFVPHVREYDIYKYEIKTKNNELIVKADPYANFCELRPKTASVVYDIERYDWHDEKWLKDAEELLYNRPVSIYEVHLGSWKRVIEENDRYLTYRELAEQLIPYVKEMGYTHIELMPIEEHPFDGSWGYQVTGYFAPTSRHGGPADFMFFVDTCHQNGIGVILDWVPAHFPKDAWALANFDGTCLYEHEDPRLGEHPDWGTLIFNYGRSEVKNFLISNAIFWIEKYHIDGLRVDAVASMLYLDYGKQDGQWIPNEYGGRENFDAVEFLKHMNSVILGKHPRVLMIAEESTAWPGVSHDLQSNGMGFRFKWNMGWMNDFLRYMAKEPIYRKHHHGDLTFSMIYAYTENFILVLSHDEVVHGKGSMIGKMPGDLWQKFANLRLAYGFMYAHPGKKLMFMGGEFAQFAEWSEAKSLDWHLLEYESHRGIQSFVKDLNHIYKSEKAFWAKDVNPDGFEWINGGDWQSCIISFARKSGRPEETLLIVCNFTPETYQKRRFGCPYAAEYVEIFNSDNAKYGGSGVMNGEAVKSDEMEWDGFENSVEISVPPLGVAIFKIKAFINDKRQKDKKDKKAGKRIKKY